MNNNSNNNVYDIKINDEYTKLVPRLSAAEYNTLKEDIKQNGIQVPIITNQDGTILDGHHRYRTS
jgi:ParB-like chromosome segregation protein Spo0J